jgi:AraC-like DNA-binding protein
MASDRDFHSPHYGRERLDAYARIPRHRHWDGYITVVVRGGYQEAGFDGRRNLTEGDVVVHRRFDAHLDHVGPGGAELVNLPLPPGLPLPAAFRIEDPDELARLAHSDPVEAVRSLCPAGTVASQADWPDTLALSLSTSDGRRLGSLANSIGLAAETLSRGFRAAYGITPARFRAEVRARQAMDMIFQTNAGLASIANDCGFSDQPHLTRAIVDLTGRTPGHWRRSNPFKTGRSECD